MKSDVFTWETSNPYCNWLDSYMKKKDELENYYFMDWKVINEPINKVVFKNIKKEEKKEMENPHARMNKLKKGMTVNTEKGRGYIVAFDYNHNKIGVKIDGFRDGQLTWCDPMLVELDYSRMNKNIVELLPAIKNVVFNDPLTVIVWADGTKTYVKASGEDTFDPEKGMALAIAKKAMENKYNYFDTIREWIEKDQKRKAKKWAKKETHIHPEEERIYFDLSGEEPNVIGDHEAMKKYYGEEELE